MRHLSVILFSVLLLPLVALSQDIESLDSFIFRTFKLTAPDINEFSTHTNAHTSSGGFVVGNGGDLVVCDKSISEELGSHELLDLVEGHLVKNYTYRDLSKKSVDEIVQKVLERLSILSTKEGENLSSLRGTLHSLIQGEVLSFIKRSEFLVDEELSDLNDSGIARVPRGCRVQQIAAQVLQPNFGEKAYLIDDYLWKKASNLSKAALMFHESFAKMYFSQGHRSTEYPRALVASLFSDQFLRLKSRVSDTYSTQLSTQQREAQGLKFFYYHRLFKLPFLGMNVELWKDSFSENEVKGYVKFYVDDREVLTFRSGQLMFSTKHPQYFTYLLNKADSGTLKISVGSEDNEEVRYYSYAYTSEGNQHFSIPILNLEIPLDRKRELTLRVNPISPSLYTNDRETFQIALNGPAGATVSSTGKLLKLSTKDLTINWLELKGGYQICKKNNCLSMDDFLLRNF